MPFHVSFGQFGPYGEHADREDDAGEFERDGVRGGSVAISPTSRVEYVGAIGSWYAVSLREEER